jgi:hypothetical protein
MTLLEAFELASYVVTVLGLPLAIYVFLREQKRARENEEEEAYQTMSDAYNTFLRLVLENADLKLRTEARTHDLTDEQRERMKVLLEMLISLFERAYILLYDAEMTPRQARRWQSWEDYMREWCRREDFRSMLPELLRGEDPDFGGYITRLAREEVGARGR